MEHDGPLLGSRPGSAANDDGSGPVVTRMASIFSLLLDKYLDMIPAATGWLPGGLELRIFQSGFSSTGFYPSVKARMYFHSVAPIGSSPSSQVITTLQGQRQSERVAGD